MVRRETATGFELSNKVDIAVATNSFRSVRGRSILCAIMDEVAFIATTAPPILMSYSMQPSCRVWHACPNQS